MFRFEDALQIVYPSQEEQCKLERERTNSSVGKTESAHQKKPTAQRGPGNSKAT